jgi:hypothetical protein
VFHNIDVLRLSPQGVRAVHFLQQEIRGLVMPPSMGNESGSSNTIKSTGPVEGTSTVTEPMPSNQDAPQDPQALKIRVNESKVGTVVHVACPTCGAQTVAEAAKPDIQKVGRLQDGISGTRLTEPTGLSPSCAKQKWN